MTRGACLEKPLLEDWVRNAGDGATTQLPSVVSSSEHGITILLQVIRIDSIKTLGLDCDAVKQNVANVSAIVAQARSTPRRRQ
jgi:hypothetical protein